MAQRVQRKLVLEDGRTFSGQAFGADTDVCAEIVFNTSMTGYQEIATDPSYFGQCVVMTYPMIGNYGITPEDFESRRVYISGMVVKELSRVASNWRGNRLLPDYLRAQGIAGLAGIDTRALVRHLRDEGAMKGILCAVELKTSDALMRLSQHPSMSGQDLAQVVSCAKPYDWFSGCVELGRASASLEETSQAGSFKVVAYDFGIKRNILRQLINLGCTVTVVPAQTPADVVLAMKPDGVFLSNGPGDPKPVTYAIVAIRKLLGRVPIFGICLGYQLLALAAGAKTYKLKFGHRGANHPVMDLRSKRAAITSQNHGFAVDVASLPRDVKATHINLNDQTLSGIALPQKQAFGVQYHPEASPGPHDSHHVFEEFIALMAAA